MIAIELASPVRTELPAVEVLVPVTKLPVHDGLATVKDQVTGKQFRVPTSGHLLYGTLLCARVDAHRVDGTSYFARSTMGGEILLEVIDGSPLRVAMCCHTGRAAEHARSANKP